MSDPPPEWGEPGSAAPERLRVKLRRGQRWALWLALGLAAVGQVAYEVAVNQYGTSTGGTATATGSCCTGPFYDRPVVAAAGFVVSAVAVALAVGTAVRARPRLPALRWSAFALVAVILVVLNLGWEAIAPLGCACF
jgi:hypothetical protein